MVGLLILAAVTVLYAGYNLFVKLSGSHVPIDATTTIMATVCIQLAALTTSGIFGLYLISRGDQVFALSSGSYFWAIAAGICIGGAEIGYLYLFGGIGLTKPMDASVVIPTIVSGTIVIALIFSFFVLNETISVTQVFGAGLVIGGIVLMFINSSTTAPH
ncbi:hypothetical protein WH96_16305 [Kiloniella spongiae]|uniref:EamA domain-containing protein n=2 Tax=Kiloniella spongiae TaxID=1489064 RepID=A0A0H2MB15_9PROT|nr:hypothetical protein WH96_16305 [Kiloniella spongiae]